MATQSPCPKCGKMVTDIPHLRKRHVNTCEGISEVEEPVVNEVEEPVVEEPKVEAPKRQKKDEKYANDDVKYLMELARAKEKEYETAPEAFVDIDALDEHMELRKAYAPETIDALQGGKVVNAADRSAYIADKNKLKLAAQRGYVPVLDGSGEFVRTSHGDVLCTISADRAKAQQESSAKVSRERLRGSEKQAASGSTMSGESADASDVVIEEATRTKIGV